MAKSITDSIHKEIILRAPLARVWRALTDSGEFGEWFGVLLDGPFGVGEKIRGQITHPGCEHMAFEAWVETMVPEQRFAFRWNPVPPDPQTGERSEPTTLVEFRLEEVSDGTRLTVTESGFDAIPKDRRDQAFRRNEGGWTEQMKNISKHVDG
ncbi:MAG: SRPBCC family protein [Planctomycetota bacterium]|jgi:uncharacterized protein YndB with AHSA1/START domain